MARTGTSNCNNELNGDVASLSAEDLHQATEPHKPKFGFGHNDLRFCVFFLCFKLTKILVDREVDAQKFIQKVS